MKVAKNFAEPPEGVIVGEDVPLENQEEQFEEKRIQEVMGTLKSIGKPYSTMSESELREEAVERLHEIN